MASQRQREAWHSRKEEIYQMSSETELLQELAKVKATITEQQLKFEANQEEIKQKLVNMRTFETIDQMMRKLPQNHDLNDLL